MNRTSRRRALTRGAAISVALALGGAVAASCGSPTKPASHATTTTAGATATIGSGPNTSLIHFVYVTVKNMKFMPADLTVKVGDVVVWRFDDGAVVHNVTSGVFKSSDESTGSFSYHFEQPGTFPYHDGLHPQMVGKVTVAR